MAVFIGIVNNQNILYTPFSMNIWVMVLSCFIIFTSLGVCTQAECEFYNAESVNLCEFEHSLLAADDSSLSVPVNTRTPFAIIDEIPADRQFIKAIDIPPKIA